MNEEQKKAIELAAYYVRDAQRKLSVNQDLADRAKEDLQEAKHELARKQASFERACGVLTRI